MTITLLRTFHLVHLLEILGKQKPPAVHQRIVHRTAHMLETLIIANPLKTDVDLVKLNLILVAKVKIPTEDPTMYLREGLVEKKVFQPHSLLVASRRKIPLEGRMNVSVNLVDDPAELSVHLARPLVPSLARRVLQRQVP